MNDENERRLNYEAPKLTEFQLSDAAIVAGVSPMAGDETKQGQEIPE